jgi:hypothetical protein
MTFSFVCLPSANFSHVNYRNIEFPEKKNS